VYQFSPLEVTKHQASVRITDQLAVTSVDQEFYNPNDRPIEGSFLFPVPKGAQLKKFTMEIEGKPVEAELLSADKARGIYEDIVRKLKDPALLEYAGRDVFKVRIFPIEARGRKRVSLSYTQLLKLDSGLISYSLPLNTEKFSAQPIPSVSFKVEVETKRPLKTIYSPSHNVEISRHGATKATVGYEARNVKPDTDFVLYFAPDADDLGVNLLTHRTGTDDGYFLLLAAPGVETKEQRIVPKDVVFVLDTSGSMAGQKLEQAKKALLFCVENLNDRDRFEVVRFATDAESLFNHLSEASRSNRTRADEFIRNLKPTGGTAIDAALKRALSFHSHDDDSQSATRNPQSPADRPFVVVFLTDGLPTIGNTDEDTIVAGVRQNSGGNVRVFCFGIGHDVNTHLLDRISGETRAFSQYVLPEEDIEVKVSHFFAKIRDPVLTRPALEFTGGIRATKLYPSPLPDLFKGEQLVLVGRYSGHGSSAAVVEGTVEGTKRRFSYDANFPAEAKEHDFIPRLWATRRVGYLLEELRLRGENSELKDEVTELARQYGIVTPYTAYLIVEDEKQRGVPMAMQSLPTVQQDRQARESLAEYYKESSTERFGKTPVARSRSELAFKAANAPAEAIALGGAEAQRGLATPLPASIVLGRTGSTTAITARPAAAAGSVDAAPTQFVAGRSFFQNGNQWIDASIQKLKDPKRNRVPLNSKEYFDLVAKSPEILPWLALGPNVQFAWAGQVYEIHE